MTRIKPAAAPTLGVGTVRPCGEGRRAGPHHSKGVIFLKGNGCRSGWCYLIPALGVALATISFFLFLVNESYIEPWLYMMFLITGGGGLFFLLPSVALAPRSDALRDAFCCCGSMAAAGGAGALITAFFLSLNDCCSCNPLSVFGVAFCFFSSRCCAAASGASCAPMPAAAAQAPGRAAAAAARPWTAAAGPPIRLMTTAAEPYPPGGRDGHSAG